MSTNLRASKRGVICHDGPFDRRTRENIVRRIRAGSKNLSHVDQVFLTQWVEGRYRDPGITRLTDIAARCTTDDGAYAVAEETEAFIAARRPAPELPIDELIRYDDASEHVGNVATREFTLTKSMPHARLMVERLYAQRHVLTKLCRAIARFAGQPEARRTW